MKSFIKGLLLFIFGLAFFLIATLPVRFALQYLPPNIPLAMQGADGTIWNGSAQQVLINGQSIGKLEWQIKPMALLTARLNADFRLDGNGVLAKGNATVFRDQSVELRDTIVNANVEQIPLPPSAQMVSPAGSASATIRRLTLVQQKIDVVDSDVIWNPARVTSPAEYELGELRLNVTGEKGNLNGILKSADGPIATDGKFSLDPSGLMKVDIKLAPDAETPADMRELLPMIGKPDRNGAVSIKQQFRLPGPAL